MSSSNRHTETTSLSDITERLPSLLLPLPQSLLHTAPAGAAKRYRPLYLELMKMGAAPDVRRLRDMAAQLATEKVTLTEHGDVRNDTQDWWFGTRRAEGDIYLIVLYGLVTAYLNALTDMDAQPHNLGRRRAALLRGGLAEMAGVAYEFLYQRDAHKRTGAGSRT